VRVGCSGVVSTRKNKDKEIKRKPCLSPWNAEWKLWATGKRKRNATHAGADLEIQVTKGMVYVCGDPMSAGRRDLWSSNGIREWRAKSRNECGVVRWVKKSKGFQQNEDFRR